MKTIIAGSRTINDPEILLDAIESSEFEITEVVSGCANGVDKLGELYAETAGLPIKKFPADWSFGKVAGIIRNRQMAEYADAAIVIWDGSSRGSKNMIEESKKNNLKLYVYNLNKA